MERCFGLLRPLHSFDFQRPLFGFVIHLENPEYSNEHLTDQHVDFEDSPDYVQASYQQ